MANKEHHTAAATAANTKFEFTGETRVEFGVTFHRIRALRDIARWFVKAGDLGGWLAKDTGLSVEGDAWVAGNARCLLSLGPIGSRADYLTIHADAKIGVRFSTGCFSGTREEFTAAVKDTHGVGAHAAAYAAAVALADLLVDPAPVTEGAAS